MAPEPPKIPDAEADVLAALFRAGEATARTLREALERDRPMAHASVVTLLQRLKSRGLVSRRKGDQGKAFLYQPTRDHARTFGPAVTSLMQRAFGGRPAALVASLFESRPPTGAEIEELDDLVRTLQKQRERGRR